MKTLSLCPPLLLLFTSICGASDKLSDAAPQPQVKYHVCEKHSGVEIYDQTLVDARIDCNDFYKLQRQKSSLNDLQKIIKDIKDNKADSIGICTATVTNYDAYHNCTTIPPEQAKMVLDGLIFLDKRDLQAAGVIVTDPAEKP